MDDFLKALAQTVFHHTDCKNVIYANVIKDGLDYCNRVDSAIPDDDIKKSIITKIWCIHNSIDVYYSYFIKSDHDEYLYSLAKSFTDKYIIKSNVIITNYYDESRHTFIIPVNFDIDFLITWYTILSSSSRQYSHNIRNYLYDLRKLNDIDIFDISVVQKDTYLSLRQFTLHCNFISENIELIKQNSVQQFHFYD